MTEAQRIWVQARDRLADAVNALDFPESWAICWLSS